MRLYGAVQENDRVKILPNESFGAMRITVERPLRLRWEVTEETAAAVSVAKGLAKLDAPARSALLDALAAHLGVSDRDRRVVAAVVDPVLRDAGLTAAQAKAVWAALAVRDPEADPVTDAKGRPQPDPELRDGENVPLPEGAPALKADPAERLASPTHRAAVDAYTAAEVHPFVPDAWVDHAKTRVGYEIPLTRHFYRYVPPRPLAEIDAEIRALEAEIQDLLAEVTE